MSEDDMVLGSITFAPNVQPGCVYYDARTPGYTVEHPPARLYRTVSDTQTTTNPEDCESGFFDLPHLGWRCSDLAHDPPSHLHIPQGKGYRHRCPGCGRTVTIIPTQVSL